MSKISVLAGLVVVAAGVTLAAQHQPSAAQHVPPANHMAAMHQHLLGGCTVEANAAETKSHVPQHLAERLALSPEQAAQIDKLAAEGCATMRRIHGEIAGVLTPEQHKVMAQMHGGTTHSALAEFFKKLHGGK